MSVQTSDSKHTQKGKTIWYCHHYAGSPSMGMSYRPYYLTKAFCQQGHRAFVISASFHHLLHNPTHQQTPLVEKQVDDVSFLFLKTRPYQNNGLARILNMLDYARQLKQQQQQLIAMTGVPDVIIVSSAHPFHLPILTKIANRYGAKLIFEVRDLWPLSLNQLLNLSAFHPLSLYLSRLEKKAYQGSDKVISLLKHAKPYMQQKGLKSEKFCYIPNGVDLSGEATELLSQAHRQAIESKSQGHFKLGYAGAMGEPNALAYLLDAMAILESQDAPVHLFLVGDGHLRTKLVEQSHRLNLQQVTFLPRIAKTMMSDFLARMDALYLGWQPCPIYQYGVSPNKLFDYMAAAKPIIESGGDPHGIISEANCGLQCNAADPQAIANTIQQICELSEQERQSMAKHAVEAVKWYDFANLASLYTKNFT